MRRRRRRRAGVRVQVCKGELGVDFHGWRGVVREGDGVRAEAEEGRGREGGRGGGGKGRRDDDGGGVGGGGGGSGEDGRGSGVRVGRELESGAVEIWEWGTMDGGKPFVRVGYMRKRNRELWCLSEAGRHFACGRKEVDIDGVEEGRWGERNGGRGRRGSG